MDAGVPGAEPSGHQKSLWPEGSAELFRSSCSFYQELFPELQELRHQADYDSNVRYKHGEVLSAVNDAEVALALGMTRS